jgi:integrase
MENRMDALPFRVFQRIGRSGKKSWSARFLDSEGKIFRTVSLPEAKTRRQAERLAQNHLELGVLPNSNNPRLGDFLKEFWTMDSDYAKGKALRGRPLSFHYVRDCLSAVEVHVIPTLGETRLGELAPGSVERLILSLSEKGLSGHRINTALCSLKVPVADFFRRHRQPDPLVSVQKVVDRPKLRGILTNDELSKIIALDESPRIKCAVLLASLCGLRAGEARGLQWDDVNSETSTIEVRNNFVTAKEGVKLPKWSKSRQVPCPKIVLDALATVRLVNLQVSPFVLFNDDRNDRPMELVSIRRGFARILTKVGINATARKERLLCFHGLRNYFVSNSRSQGIPDFVVQRLAGHSEMAMTDRYTRVGTIDFQEALSKMNGTRAPADEAIK